MPRKIPSAEKLDEFREFMNEMMAMRLDLLSATATKYAETLGAVRAALEKSGFSTEESMQIVLRIVEQQGRRPMPMHAGGHGRWDK